MRIRNYMRYLSIGIAVLGSFAIGLAVAQSRQSNQAIDSPSEIQPGFSQASVVRALQSKYLLKTEDVGSGITSITATDKNNGSSWYEINCISGYVAAIWNHDSRSYGNDSIPVVRELFDSIYSQADESSDAAARKTLGVRYLTLHVEMHRPPTGNIDRREIIFDLPGEDFRLSLTKGSDPNGFVSISRVKSATIDQMKAWSK